MKRLYYVKSEDFNMIISDDGELRRVMTCDQLPYDIEEDEALDELERVTDDSDWDEYTDTVTVLAACGEIVAEREWEDE